MMKWILVVVLAYSLVILVVLLGLQYTLTMRQLVVGPMFVVFAIAMYAFPLSIMVTSHSHPHISNI